MESIHHKYDEPIKLPDGFTPVSRSHVIDHKCEYEGCCDWGGWGLGKPKGERTGFASSTGPRGAIPMICKEKS